MTAFLIWAGSFLKRVPWQAWAVVALVAAVWWYGHSRYNAGWEAHQRAQEAAEAKADAKAAKAGERAQKVADDASATIKKETDDAAAEVREIVRTIPRACPDPVLPERVHDRLGEAVQRAREALPD